MHKKQPSDSKSSIRVFYRDQSLETVLCQISLYSSICLLLLLYDNELLITVQM